VKDSREKPRKVAQPYKLCRCGWRILSRHEACIRCETRMVRERQEAAHKLR
jgi:hypothetical protein